LTSLRRTLSRDASWRPSAPTLHMLAYSLERSLILPKLPRIHLRTSAASSNGAGDVGRMEPSTWSTTSESERHSLDSDATTDLT
jgi:hypothetical protein